MSDNRLSKTDELAEILDEYRAKKKAAQTTPEPVEDPASKEAPTVAIESATRVRLPAESDGQPAEEETVYTEVSEEVASHFADSVSEESTGVSSHFSETEDDDPYIPEEYGTDGEDEEDEDEAGEYAHLPLIFRMIMHIGDGIANMSFLLKAVLYIAVVLIIASYLSYYVLTLANDVLALVTGESEIKVTVPENATEEEIAAILSENGLIDYDWAFMFVMKYYGDGEKIDFISGEHTLNTSMNYSQLLTALTTPYRVREIVTLTFPEGYTVDDIIALFVKNGVGTREGFVEAINEYPYKHEFVQLLETQGWDENRVYRLEGYLYPDTYDFYTDTEEYLAINKLLNNFGEKVWDDWKSTYESYCTEQGYTLDDIVTLSSMIEAEGKTAEDFEYISYVFRNRLKNSASFPKLESDATIQYALELAGLDRVQDSSLIDVDFESPYNTYLYDGLPPGAICNAGLDAILSAIYPSPPYDENDKEINAFFFVSNNAGQTYYAATVSAHERNKRRVAQENAEMAENNEDL